MKAGQSILNRIFSRRSKKELKEQQASSSLEPKKKQIISSITDLMLDKFIICMCDDDLSVLVIDWTNVNEDDVKAAWENILDEYKEALKSREQEHLESISREINYLVTKKNTINACLYRLAIAYSKETVAELSKWTLVIEKFDTSKDDQYYKDIESVKARNARIDIDIRHLKEELNKSLPEGIENKTDKYFFEKQIIHLEKHMHKPIIKSQTTVANFVFMIVDMIMRAEELERQNNSHHEH
jgi:hypothetical protein